MCCRMRKLLYIPHIQDGFLPSCLYPPSSQVSHQRCPRAANPDMIFTLTGELHVTPQSGLQCLIYLPPERIRYAARCDLNIITQQRKPRQGVFLCVFRYSGFLAIHRQKVVPEHIYTVQITARSSPARSFLIVIPEYLPSSSSSRRISSA